MRHFGGTAGWRRQQGFSLFELAVSAIIVSVLTGVLLMRLIEYREQAELASVERLVGILRSALALKSGSLAARGQEEEIASLASINPLELLSEKPANYIGEYYRPDIDDLPKGNWFFDRSSKTLVYLLNHRKRFPQGTPSALYFKVEFSRLPKINAKPTGTPNASVIALIQVNR